jgi:hypothetical protein
MQNAECRITHHVSRLTSLPLLVEKLPFFALAAASSVVTLLVQQRAVAVAAADALPLELRLENAVVSYLLYLTKRLGSGREEQPTARVVPGRETFP